MRLWRRSVPASIVTKAAALNVPLLMASTTARGAADGWQLTVARVPATYREGLALPRVALCNATRRCGRCFTRSGRVSFRSGCQCGRCAFAGTVRAIDYCNVPVFRCGLPSTVHLAAQLAADGVRPNHRNRVLARQGCSEYVAALESVVAEWIFVRTHGPREEPDVSAQRHGQSAQRSE